MKAQRFADGVWPVMLTPFTTDNQVDYEGLKALTRWYIDQGADGLFAVCQSSEMFFLSQEERVAIIETVKAASAGRVSVIASGHTAETLEAQAEQILAAWQAGAEAVVLITNRLAGEDEPDGVWLENLKKLLAMVPEEIPLGLYECPYPYKRLVSLENLKWVSATGRFYFLKDTCCCLETLRQRIEVVKGSCLKVYNANTATLLDSLRMGAAGYSGVMANFHPESYAWLVRHADDERAGAVNAGLTIAALIERQVYPVNAKYYLKAVAGLPVGVETRTKACELLDETGKSEVKALGQVTELLKGICGL